MVSRATRELKNLLGNLAYLLAVPSSWPIRPPLKPD